MIKIEHSIFALPYAYAGAFLAIPGLPDWLSLFLLTIAMVAVRSFAMAYNRIADFDIDKKNPRTCNRPLQTGKIDIQSAWVFVVVSAIIFIGACNFINSTCFLLSFPALLFSAAYSYIKRYSSICHFWLGATLGLAPIAGWLAVKPPFPGLPAILLFLAVLFWVAAFDIYYSFQDYLIDKQEGLHSLPADLGKDQAMLIAGFSHIMTVIFLILCGLSSNLGWPWYFVCAGIAILLFWEHRLVNPEDLKNINMAFFTLNGIISPLILAGAILGIYF